MSGREGSTSLSVERVRQWLSRRGRDGRTTGADAFLRGHVYDLAALVLAQAEEIEKLLEQNDGLHIAVLMGSKKQEEFVSLLQELEWCRSVGWGRVVCWFCGAIENDGHENDCRLAAALGDRRP